MAIKKLELDGIGTVSLYKRKGARHIRLSITHAGDIRVTLPWWASYQAGIDFIESKRAWIEQQKPETELIKQGHSVGKAHHITFEPGSGASISTRISGNEVRILLPVGVRWDSVEAQQAAQSVGVRALKKEAKRLLPHRLQILADQHNYDFRSTTIKQLKGRWGSCSEQKDIVLNCFLMKLPWDLIDYVLLHELAHTRVMAHGPAFWQEMSGPLPHVQMLRQQIKQHKPIL